MFLTNITYFHYKVQNHFFDKLSRYCSSKNPLKKARCSLSNYMKAEINKFMSNTDLGVVPSIQLPPSLLTFNNPTGPSTTTPGSTDKQPQNPPGFRKNPNPQSNWQPPNGKPFTDFFNVKTNTGKRNLALLPTFLHHAAGKQAGLCLKYQMEDKKSKYSCTRAHVTASAMTQSERAYT